MPPTGDQKSVFAALFSSFVKRRTLPIPFTVSIVKSDTSYFGPSPEMSAKRTPLGSHANAMILVSLGSSSSTSIATLRSRTRKSSKVV